MHDEVGSAADGAAVPAADPAELRAFWGRARRSLGEVGLGGDAAITDMTDITAFGDHPELADELIQLVLTGPKRATATSVAELEAVGAAPATPGDRWIACDGGGRPRAVLGTTEVRIGPLSSVDDRFAWDEGEGDRTRADWLAAHTEYFSRRLASLGVPFHADIPVVFERFEVLYAEDATGRPLTLREPTAPSPSPPPR